MAFLSRLRTAILATCIGMVVAIGQVQASPVVVVDVDSGNVLYQEGATTPWYPASLTKLMTVYVALSAVREGRITFDTPMMVSPRAASMEPSKMGFRPGTLVTLDNALKMLMVKSPNDVAVTIAEGISGSVEAFAADMNVYATRLGLHESHFMNPNGLPNDQHMSSARDMAIIARALLKDFPEQRGLFGIGQLAFGSQLINNHNGLLGRYQGVDGMKTGYTCAAGYNVVASAERDGRRLIVVIMGAPSNNERNERAAILFDRFFAGTEQSIGRLESLPSSSITVPVSQHDVICSRNRGRAVTEAEAEDTAIPLSMPDQNGENHPEQVYALQQNGQGVTGAVPGSSLSPVRESFVPVRVTIGPVPGWTGRIAQAVGSGSKELSPAPARGQIEATRQAPEAAGDANQPGQPFGAIEAPSAAPMALLGATPVAPAALATRRFVRSTPSLPLTAVGPRGRRRAARAQVASRETEPVEKPGPKVKAAKGRAVAVIERKGTKTPAISILAPEPTRKTAGKHAKKPGQS